MIDYDRSKWELMDHQGSWAVLRSKALPHNGCVIQQVDGDWELNDQGRYEEMFKKFRRVAGVHPDDGFIPDASCPVDLDDLPTAFAEPADPVTSHPNFGRF